MKIKFLSYDDQFVMSPILSREFYIFYIYINSKLFWIPPEDGTIAENVWGNQLIY